jgi:hypothetical protein
MGTGPKSLPLDNKILLNERLDAIKMPYKHSRAARKFKQNSWKAIEYYNFVLYYFPVLMHDLLSPTLFNHFMKFVRGLRILCSKSILTANLNRAEDYLKNFVKETQQIYGPRLMDFVVHSCKHLVYFVKLFGPLWVFHNFQFEGLLKRILATLQGTREFEKQFLFWMKSLVFTADIENHIPAEDLQNPHIAKLFTRLGSSIIGERVLKTKFCSQVCQIAAENRSLIVEHLNNDDRFTCFQRVRISTTVYCTQERAEKQRYDSSWVVFKDPEVRRVGRIQCIVQAPNQNVIFIIRQYKSVQNFVSVDERYLRLKSTNTLYLIEHPLIVEILLPIIVEDIGTFVSFSIKH